MIIKVPIESLNDTATNLKAIESKINQDLSYLNSSWNSLIIEAASKKTIDTIIGRAKTSASRLAAESNRLSNYVFTCSSRFVEADKTESNSLQQMNNTFSNTYQAPGINSGPFYNNRLSPVFLAAGLGFLGVAGIFGSVLLPWIKGVILQKPVGTMDQKPNSVAKVDNGHPNTGKIDGQADGYLTKEVLSDAKQLVGIELLERIGWSNLNEKMVDDLNYTLNTYEINTPERISHFLSQCAHESNRGLWLTELSSGMQYENRTDLGNVEIGDGVRFKGSGYIQLTGRYNYQQFADAMNDQRIMEGSDYVSKNYPWSSAGFWWSNNNMNNLIDLGASMEEVTQRVNGGQRGIDERRNYYNSYSEIFANNL